jgi:2-haloacid dehalogenase
MLLLDSLETCLSLEPLRDELSQLGLRSEDLELWFSRSLRDAFARECALAYQPFSTVLASTLAVLARARGLALEQSAIEKLVASFAELPPHEDVRSALELAKAERMRVAVLTNGGSEATRNAFANAGLAELVETFVSADDAKHFKPAPQAYLHAAFELGVDPRKCTLIAAHGWDILGALRAGLDAAFVQRAEPLEDELATRVEASATRLDDLIRQLVIRDRRYRLIA